MKKLFFLVLLVSNFFGYAQYTLIPDVNFEKALIKKLIDTGVPDGKVLTANIIGVTDLNINGEGVIDITGLQAFVNLKFFSCLDNSFTSLDLSKNTFLEYLDCSLNKLTSLDLSKNIKLTNLVCAGNQLTTLDVSTNTALIYLDCGFNQLTSIDVAKNTALRLLICRYNQLVNLDVSNNKILITLECYENNLLALNLKNGNNTAMSSLSVILNNNPKLTCIQVDNKSYSDTNWSNNKDATAIYSEDCSKTTAPIALPTITATGNQTYCPGTSLKIVETIDITSDHTEPETDAIYIQISSGYVSGQDLLALSNPLLHPTITTLGVL